MPVPLACETHGARVRVGQRDLLVGLLLQFLTNRVHALHLLAQGADLLAQPLGLGFDLGRLGAVGGLQRAQVALDAFFDLLMALVDLARSEVTVAAVDALELAAVNGHDGLRKELRSRHTCTKRRQTFRMPSPLSWRKSAMVLKSGASRPVSHISSTLRCASRSSRRLDAMRFKYP